MLRRKPLQTRSKLMVKSIIDAGFIALKKHGIEGTTTRHVADIAGISPGTLYQYFPDKAAIYQAMSERFLDDFEGWLQAETSTLVQKKPEELVASLLYGFRDLLQRQDGLYLEFARHAYRFIRPEHMARLERTLLALAAQFVLRHSVKAGKSNKNLPAMLYIMIYGGTQTMISYLSAPNPYFSFDDLVQGLVRMVGGLIADETR